MSYIKSLLPNSIPNSVDSSDNLTLWQEKSLHLLALVGTFAGLIFLFVKISTITSSPDLPGLIGSVLLFVISLLVFFGRGISYRLRSILFFGLAYVLLQVLFIKNGWSGEPLL
ncbi:hypothetical protein EG832_16645, partial [bacterium]|nr:hypothetical protein [bacterium]